MLYAWDKKFKPIALFLELFNLLIKNSLWFNEGMIPSLSCSCYFQPWSLLRVTPKSLALDSCLTITSPMLIDIGDSFFIEFGWFKMMKAVFLGFATRPFEAMYLTTFIAYFSSLDSNFTTLLAEILMLVSSAYAIADAYSSHSSKSATLGILIFLYKLLFTISFKVNN